MTQREIAIIGGGIVGLATARALSERSSVRLLILEAEARLAAHQTGHNSGVIHSGLYYRPGSLKARLCVSGREAMYAYCREQGVAHERCGKVVVAVEERELPALAELERRGRDNGLVGVERLDAAALRRREPHVTGRAGLAVPETGIVDYREVCQRLAAELTERGVEVRLGARVRRVERTPGGFRLHTTGSPATASALINCAGLQSDRVARLCGVDPQVRIVPFRGEYYRLRAERQELVRHLIYPVPDARYPFLGVHFTRMVGGGVEAGPNAVLALDRHGYTRFDLSARDLLSIVSYGGFWRMAARHWRTGLSEVHRSWSRRAFVRALQRLVPDLRPEDVERHGAGVRAQAVDSSGALVDDFRIIEAPGMLHVLNAPSPAATASLAIGAYIAEGARRHFGL